MLCIVYYKMKTCACIIHYHVMFTCTLLRSHLESKKTLGETWATAIKAIKTILWTSVASKCSLTGMGAGPGSVCGQKGTMKDVFARCLKRTDVQVCTLTLCIYRSVIAISTSLLHMYLSFTINNYLPLACTSFCDCIITGVYFSQVKNKPWIPWVYTWIWHCRKQLLLFKYVFPGSIELSFFIQFHFEQLKALHKWLWVWDLWLKHQFL